MALIPTDSLGIEPLVLLDSACRHVPGGGGGGKAASAPHAKDRELFDDMLSVLCALNPEYVGYGIVGLGGVLIAAVYLLRGGN